MPYHHLNVVLAHVYVINDVGLLLAIATMNEVNLELNNLMCHLCLNSIKLCTSPSGRGLGPLTLKHAMRWFWVRSLDLYYWEESPLRRLTIP